MLEQRVSVIIPTYNRIDLLECVLPSYLDQREINEVIIVNDCSTDDTAVRLSKIANTEKRLVVINQPINKGLPNALNTAITVAKMPLILRGGDSIELVKGFARILIAHLNEQMADIIAARMIFLYKEEGKEGALKRADKKRGPFVVPALQKIGDAELGGGKDLDLPILSDLFLMKKEVATSIKFDENFGGYPYRLEADFTFTAKQRGFKLIYCPHAVCFHHWSSSYVNKKRRSLWSENKWILINHYYFLKKHSKYLSSLLGFKGSPTKLIISFFILRIYGQLRNILYCGKQFFVNKFGF